MRVATLDEPEHGLSGGVLAETDVLIWWSHTAHAEVSDETVTRVQARVLEGMGLIVLDSAHFSKICRRRRDVVHSISFTNHSAPASGTMCVRMPSQRH